VRKLLFYITFFFSAYLANSQILFEQDIVQGGVSAGGFSTGSGTGSGMLNLYIEPGSTIKKAYLFAYRIGFPPSVPININGTPFLFDTTNSIMNVNHASAFVSPINLYYHDVTNYLNSNFTTSFNITIPAQNGLPINWGYWTVTIFVVYENPLLSFTNYCIFINDKNFIGNENYFFNNLNPINTINPVGLSIFMDRACNDLIADGNSVVLNSINILGLIGGSDAVNNNWDCAGSKGHFYYQNNTLFGLDDDVANNTMDSSDALADISSYILNNTTTYNLNLGHNFNSPTTRANITSLFINAYTTPCDTFTTTATTTQDTICLGNSVQLNATGGSTYSWYSPFSTFNDSTLANPLVTPSQTTTYIVTIKNDSGCVKTEHVKIWVTQPIDSTATTPTVCGNTTGRITTHYNTNTNYNFTLYDNNFNPLANNTTGIFNQLAEGTYIVENSLNNCAFYDTVTVNAINNVQAAFIRNPTQGKAPLTVTLTNISNNANQFIWLLPNDTFYSQHLTYTFTNGGSYPVCLVAYNNQPHCADTTCFTFIVEGNIGLIIPNVFTPNNDGHNDVFSIQVIDAELISTIEVIIYNRWGEKMYEYTNNESAPELLLWDGVTSSGNKVSEGTYFYVVSYTTKLGETVTQKGTLSLLR
jgi:gliding motility-associated-like protein